VLRGGGEDPGDHRTVLGEAHKRQAEEVTYTLQEGWSACTNDALTVLEAPIYPR
jgi:hypothetical protein